MRADFLTSNAWEQSNQKIKSLFAATVSAGEFDVRCYKGLAAGLLEVLSGTASFLSHKRTLGIVMGQTWVQESLMPTLLRDNFQIKYFTKDDLKNPEKIMTDLEGEASCFVWPEDHPITGEVFNGEALEEALAKKRIFSIRLSHHAYRTRPLKLSPYAVRLCSVTNDLSVAVTGARFKTPTWIAPMMSWDPAQVESQIKEVMSGATEKQDQVQSFEATLQKGWQPYFKSNERLWDRAVIFNLEVAGDQVLQDLSEKLQRPLPKAGEKGWIETTHLCRWETSLRALIWWKEAPKADILRGLILLDAEVLEDPRLQSYFR